MVSQEQLYNFLKKHYRHERFEGRNGKTWGESYSINIANHSYRDLADYGYSLISSHESATGKAVIFDTNLNVMAGIPKKEKAQEVHGDC